MRVRWIRPALRDLEAIGEASVKEYSTHAAARTVTPILDQAETLAEFPQVGRPGRISGTSELVVTGTPFVVPYRVTGDKIEILAVFHGARQWPESFGR
jgi:toxin ParE1/3/4